jgi:hypothetical protein
METAPKSAESHLSGLMETGGRLIRHSTAAKFYKEDSYVFGTCKDRAAADDLFSLMRRNAFSILGSRNALPVRHLPATGTPILEPSRTVA